MSTNLRLLLDECITNPLAEVLKGSSSLNVEYVRELGIRGAEDAAVVKYAISTKRIVVTTETGINHKKFKICTHPGIIVLSGRHRHEAIHARVFEKFLLSGHRKQAEHAVTFLSEKEARIKTAESSPDTVIRF